MTKTELSRELKKAARRVRLAKTDAARDIVEEYVNCVLAEPLRQVWLEAYQQEQARRNSLAYQDIENSLTYQYQQEIESMR